MATQRSSLRKKKTAAKAVASKKHPHRLAGTKAKKAAVLGGLLDAIGGTKKAKTKKKSDKPVIRMDDQAQELLELAKAKAAHKTLGSRIKALESELADDAEDLRLNYCIDHRDYFGSVTLQAIGEDDEGKTIDARETNYGVKRQHIKFDPREASADDDVIEVVGEDATIRDEAILAISNALDIEWEKAEEEYESRLDTKTVISLSDGALDDPDVVAILQEHLAEWLESTTTTTPTEGFSEQSCYDARSISIMEALNDVGLCKRYKATFKPSGAPAQNLKPARRKRK